MSAQAPTISMLTGRRMTKGATRELNGLLEELRPGGGSVSLACWQRVMTQENLRVFAISFEKNIVGIATLRWHELPQGRAALLEDVVVASRVRGRGFGERLVRHVADWAEKRHIRYIDLTSRPDRKAANALYQKLGWEKRTTNVYRLSNVNDAK